MKHKAIFFISDLHLSAEREDLTQLFFKFLEEYAKYAQKIYILGDFFNVWLGDDDSNLFTQRIIKALKQASQRGIEIYVMRGNRDLMLGQRFTDAIAGTLLPDPSVIDLFGHPTLLMHGDSLCRLDVKYQRFRAQVRHPLVRGIYLTLPLFLRRYIARRLRRASQQHQRQQQPAIMDVTQEAVIESMQQFKSRQLIHGHVHRAAIHPLEIDGQVAQRYVLGDWGKTGNFLECWPHSITYHVFQ